MVKIFEKEFIKYLINWPEKDFRKFTLAQHSIYSILNQELYENQYLNQEIQDLEVEKHNIFKISDKIFRNNRQTEDLHEQLQIYKAKYRRIWIQHHSRYIARKLATKTRNNKTNNTNNIKERI